MNSFLCSHALACLVCLAAPASAQSISMTSAGNQPGQPAQWFRHGRTIPGEPAALLRYRAHRQRLQMRALDTAVSRLAGSSALPRVAPGTAWKPLGPLPLASDATGLGVQDYGPVAGRATAVAVDPADGTGNTVYVGGAYGGVWKSNNAGPLSPNPSSVTWTPLTDNQPTLAVGSSPSSPNWPVPTRAGVWYWRVPARRTVPPIHTTDWVFCAPSMQAIPGPSFRKTAPAGLLRGWASARSRSAPPIPRRWSRPPRERRRASSRGSRTLSSRIAGFTSRTMAENPGAMPW